MPVQIKEIIFRANFTSNSASAEGKEESSESATSNTLLAKDRIQILEECERMIASAIKNMSER